MATFKIHLAKVGTLTIPERDIKTNIQDWFTRVIKDNKRLRRKYTAIEVVWWKDMNKDIKVGDRDILIYLLKNRSHSIIKKKWGAQQADLAGLTYVDSRSKETISEVYCGCRSGRFIAETIFHEALHNKTGWSDEKQHKRGGLADYKTSITDPKILHMDRYLRTVPKGTRMTTKVYERLLCKKVLEERYASMKGILTKKNISDMAGALDKKRKQWAAGFTFLRNRNKKIDLSGNPLDGL